MCFNGDVVRWLRLYLYYKKRDRFMEWIISIALGAWIAFGGWISYRSIKKEFTDEGDHE